MVTFPHPDQPDPDRAAAAKLRIAAIKLKAALNGKPGQKTICGRLDANIKASGNDPVPLRAAIEEVVTWTKHSAPEISAMAEAALKA